MEGLVGDAATRWRGKSVTVTGHTGFKGGWLSLWLEMLGAQVHGFALDPPTKPSLFETAKLADLFASDVRANLSDGEALKRALLDAAPEIVFHLAAQPLVRASYQDPIGTFTDNVMGTARVLEAARHVPSIRAIVVITTDKVYENKEWAHPYRESDPLGGHDPYSASKAAAEIVTASFRSSFFLGDDAARIATARAGNVIGGGDWAMDRLVPDCLRAFSDGLPVRIRNPQATRPWQHVLEPLAGYLKLAEALLRPDGGEACIAWNFGPDASGDETVGAVANRLAEAWGPGAQIQAEPEENAPHEAGQLRLDSSLAQQKLDWTPRWSVDEAVARTADWHRAWLAQSDMRAFSRDQIRAYVDASSGAVGSGGGRAGGKES